MQKFQPKRLEHGGKHAVWRNVAGPYLFGMAQDVFVAPGGDFLVDARAGRLGRNEQGAPFTAGGKQFGRYTFRRISVGIFRLKRGDHAPDAQLYLADMVLRDAKALCDFLYGALFKHVCAVDGA